VEKVQFFIGETFSIEIEIGDEEGNPIDLTNHNFLLFLYVHKWEIIRMSTLDSDGSIKITKNNTESKLEVTIPAEISRKLRPGIARLEMRIQSEDDNWISIGTVSSIELLPNKIGTFDETFTSPDDNDFLNECLCDEP